jgi:hypothetical protein
MLTIANEGLLVLLKVSVRASKRLIICPGSEFLVENVQKHNFLNNEVSTWR